MTFFVVVLILVGFLTFLVMDYYDLRFKGCSLFKFKLNFTCSKFEQAQAIYPNITDSYIHEKDLLFAVKNIRKLECAILKRHREIFSLDWEHELNNKLLLNRWMDEEKLKKLTSDTEKLKKEIELLKKHLWDAIVLIYTTDNYFEPTGKNIYDSLLKTAEKYDNFLKVLDKYQSVYFIKFKWLDLSPLLT